MLACTLGGTTWQSSYSTKFVMTCNIDDQVLCHWPSQDNVIFKSLFISHRGLNTIRALRII